MAKKAFLAGINIYANPQFNLRGCVYDSESLARLLTSVYAFQGGDIEVISDAEATKATILAKLEHMLSSAAVGDVLVFGYSGHGTELPDRANASFKDQCIVPYEANYKSLIRDEELNALFAKYVTEGIKFTAIFDCCHSGTITKNFMFQHNGDIVVDVINRYIGPFDPTTTLIAKDRFLGPYNVLSACRDAETAADVARAGPDQGPRGAFSYALHNVLLPAKDLTPALAEPQILAGIGQISKHVQNPVYQTIDAGSPLIRY